MRSKPPFLSALWTTGVLFAASGLSASAAAQSQTLPLDTLDGLKPHKVVAEAATYLGRKAVRVMQAPDLQGAHEDKLAVLTALEFEDGTIEVDLAGKRAAGASGQARGFVGIAFRVAPDVSAFECFYLRPTNGRAEDQVRRNHSTQYVSFPGYPWHRLRRETPGKYESYVDLVEGEWTQVKIEVSGQKARLYVHGAEQPSLVVNDLKQGQTRGAIGLWIGVGTEAFFSNLRVSPSRP